MPRSPTTSWLTPTLATSPPSPCHHPAMVLPQPQVRPTTTPATEAARPGRRPTGGGPFPSPCGCPLYPRGSLSLAPDPRSTAPPGPHQGPVVCMSLTPRTMVGSPHPLPLLQLLLTLPTRVSDPPDGIQSPGTTMENQLPVWCTMEARVSHPHLSRPQYPALHTPHRPQLYPRPRAIRSFHPPQPPAIRLPQLHRSG